MFGKIRLQSKSVMLNCFRYNHLIPKERLQDKVAIVTASTKGIGLAIAKRLAQEGAKVIVSSRREENVKQAVKTLSSQNLNVTGVVCHVAKPDDRRKLFDEANKLGGVDILVSNAAVNPAPSLMVESSEKTWDKIFDVNLKSAFMLSKDAILSFKKKGGGCIVYISSYIGYQPPMAPVVGLYSVSKTALLGLTKAFALETATQNIRINCVCPGSVSTEFGNYIINNEEFSKIALAFIPMRRFGEPDEIAGAVAFLASDDAKYITGESIVAAGGGPSRL